MDDKYLKEAMESVLRKMGLEPDTSWRVEPFEANLWISLVFRVIVYKQGKVYASLFVKRMPDDRKRREYFLPHLTFSNEETSYTKVLAAFTDLQKEAGLEEIIQFSPRCYYTMCDGENDVIIVEDLTTAGYSVLSRKVPMKIAELRLLMRLLGQFHALSFAMKAKDPHRFKQLSSAVKETVWIDAHVYNTTGNVFQEAGKEVFELLVNMKSSNAQKLEYFLTQNHICLQRLCRTDSENEPWNVITHGDIWPSNVLVTSPPNQRLRLVDFQLCRYCSPATDVSSVLYLCMDAALREAHREELLQLYHSSMSQLLVQLDLDPVFIFPYSQVEEQLKKYGSFGLGIGFLNIPHAMNDSDEAIRAENDISMMEAVANERCEMTELCKQRILDNITDAVQRGYFD